MMGIPDSLVALGDEPKLKGTLHEPYAFLVAFEMRELKSSVKDFEVALDGIEAEVHLSRYFEVAGGHYVLTAGFVWPSKRDQDGSLRRAEAAHSESCARGRGNDRGSRCRTAILNESAAKAEYVPVA